ncbi:hypothetical protein C8R43DRAFT_1200753 [Mycena crocata]|nr:hypothetical protein C8R43DRAFT_1200753 [Mycena crocata]
MYLEVHYGAGHSGKWKKNWIFIVWDEFSVLRKGKAFPNSQSYTHELGFRAITLQNRVEGYKLQKAFPVEQMQNGTRTTQIELILDFRTVPTCSGCPASLGMPGIGRNLHHVVGRQAGRPHAKPDADETSTALPAHSGSGNNGNHHNGCWNCGRPGHRENDCRDKQNGIIYTDQQKQDNYARTMRNRKRYGGQGSSSDTANLAREHSPDIAFMALGQHEKLTRQS